MGKKLRWGLIGGGKGSQIGPAHRLGAQADGLFAFVAGALDHDPAAGRAFGLELGLDEDRAYGTWREMLESEKDREDGVDLVTVATPNATHFEIAVAFLRAGFNVLCEKPMAMTVAECEEIARAAETSGKVCAVNYCYSAYPMVREMREMIRRGDLGAIRLAVANFSHGHHADAGDEGNARVRWRYDPEIAGASGQMADCGIHALHLASFVTGDEVAKLSADFASCVPGRALEDEAMICYRTEGGIVGRLWTSSVAVGRQHGLDLQVFGEKGGVRWASERPNQLYWTPLGERTQIVEKGDASSSSEAARLSRVPIAHPEGFPLAIANVYVDLSAAIRGEAADGLPTPEDGLRSIAAIHAAVESAKVGGAWTDARPPMLRRGNM